MTLHFALALSVSLRRSMLFIVVLTYIGMQLRGPYWQFYWPWQAWPSVPGRI